MHTGNRERPVKALDGQEVLAPAPRLGNSAVWGVGCSGDPAVGCFLPRTMGWTERQSGSDTRLSEEWNFVLQILDAKFEIIRPCLSRFAADRGGREGHYVHEVRER